MTPWKGPLKQCLMVLGALESGAETTREVAAITGLPNKHCSAALNELRLCGLATIVKRGCIKFPGAGRPSHQWGVVKG